MKILAKAICKGCGKEFDPRSGMGKPRTYCSPKCKNARNNNAFLNKQEEKLGMSYYSWKWRNDPTFKEKKREYDHEYNLSLAERRREKGKEEE